MSTVSAGKFFCQPKNKTFNIKKPSLTPPSSTGRAGQDGRAITFFGEAEKHLAGALVNVLKAAGQPVPEELMKYGTTVKKKGHEAYGAFYKDTEGMKAATKITFD
jgi:ATP-dependent RNA helicase DBP3